MNLTIDGWMVGWSLGKPDAVEVGPWPDRTRWSDRYDFVSGCCNLGRHKMPHECKVTLAFIDFHSVVNDGVDAKTASRQFCKIADFRQRVAPDHLMPQRQSEYQTPRLGH
jgi:hypothetical protein